MFSLKNDEGCESLANIILPAIHERETLEYLTLNKKILIVFTEFEAEAEFLEYK